jgi:hypothetical protein
MELQLPMPVVVELVFIKQLVSQVAVVLVAVELEL